MSVQVTIAQLQTILHAVLLNCRENCLTTRATGISTDTRTLQGGTVFLALRGETFDGHQFIATAIERGAVAAIVDAQFDPANGSTTKQDFPLLQVTDTLQAYQAIAQWWRNQFEIPVIAVTGSVGKTTTKELIAAVLSTLGTGGNPAHVLKTQANYNNEIGVPKTLLELTADHQYAIVEMGMRGRGEIALLSQIARPTIAVITNVGTAHIGRLGSELAIAEAKCELLAEMPHDSSAVLNYDNPLLQRTAESVWQGKTITFGLTGGTVHGTVVDHQTLMVAGCKFPLPLPGRHNALNYLAALTVAKVLGLSWNPLLAGITVELPHGRSQRIELPNDVLILDETYNAGLESMLAALYLLTDTPGQRHIAVLGTMKELGDRAPEFHHQVGVKAAELQLDHLLILADEPEAIALLEGAQSLSAETFNTHTEVVDRLKQLVQPGDRILFKASRSVRLDQVVAQFRQDYLLP